MIAFDASVLFGAIEPRGSVPQKSRRVLGMPQPHVTSEACIAEAMHLAGSRLKCYGQDRLWAVLRIYQVEIVSSGADLAERLMNRYRDVPMDFADATLVALASADPRVRIATFDSDFLAYRRDDGTHVPLIGDRLLGWE